MKHTYLIALILLIAETALSAQPKTKHSTIQPTLGSCSPYSDYYIYQCKAFECRLPIAGYSNAVREMKTIGMQDDKCIHQYSIIVNDPKYPSARFDFTCHLSEGGRREMAALFTKYRDGDASIYSQPVAPAIINKECTVKQ